jgi:hypothetical protein
MSRIPELIFTLILVSVFIFGSESGTLRNPKQNLCVEAKPRFQFHLVTCKSGSPSQSWLFNGSFIHNEKEQTCLTSTGMASKMTGSCSVEFYPSKAVPVQIMDRTFTAHGRHLKTAKGECLAMNSSSLLIFLPCEHADTNTEIVFE